MSMNNLTEKTSLEIKEKNDIKIKYIRNLYIFSMDYYNKIYHHHLHLIDIQSRAGKEDLIKHRTR